MLTSQEKLAFAQRLRKALKRSPKKVETPTELALQFSLRHKGGQITPQAAQKWLTGQAQPSPEKIETLAEWLNVSPRWLRFGVQDERPSVARGEKEAGIRMKGVLQPTQDELELLATLRALPEHQQGLVHEIIEQFSLEVEMWRD